MGEVRVLLKPWEMGSRTESGLYLPPGVGSKEKVQSRITSRDLPNLLDYNKVNGIRRSRTRQSDCPVHQ